jgi:5-methyltetrahydropteroyltriglutamate--homocysteine methyltransferase
VRDVVARQRDAGIELRARDDNFAGVDEVPTDWQRFPEFYADYFAREQEYDSPRGEWVCVGPVTYTGGRAIERDIANLKSALDAAGVEDGFLPVVAPASCFPSLIDEHYGSEAAARSTASPRSACATTCAGAAGTGRIPTTSR